MLCLCVDSIAGYQGLRRAATGTTQWELRRSVGYPPAYTTDLSSRTRLSRLEPGPLVVVGITDGADRASVGLEDVRDLVEDFEIALA